MSCDLQIDFFERGYDEKIKISLSTAKVLFSGYCDSLVTSKNNEIEFQLNFGQHGHTFNHILRRSGDYVVLVPSVAKEYLSNFFTLRIQGAIIFRFEDATKIWTLLRYDPTELNNLVPIKKEEWMLFWLLNIPAILNNLSVEELATWILKRIVAEEPENKPNVKEIIRWLLSGEGEFLNNSISRSNELKPVIAYINETTEGLFEWHALDASDRYRLLLGNGWSIKTNEGQYSK